MDLGAETGIDFSRIYVQDVFNVKYAIANLSNFAKDSEIHVALCFETSSRIFNNFTGIPVKVSTQHLGYCTV